jgi:hypothetical protein
MDWAVFRNIGLGGTVAPASTCIPELLGEVSEGRINPGARLRIQPRRHRGGCVTTMASLILATILGGGFIVGVQVLAHFAMKRGASQRSRLIAGWYGLGTWSPLVPEPDLEQWVCTVAPHGAGTVRHLKATRGEHRGFTFLAVHFRYYNASIDDGVWLGRKLVTLNLPKATPDLEIVRKRPNRESLALGWQPFDQSFRVSTSDSAFAQALLTTPTMQWMLSDPRSQYFPIMFRGTTLGAMYEAEYDVNTERFDIHHLGAPADYLVELASRIPEEVWE